MKVQIEIVKKLVRERMTDVLFYMQTAMGIPADILIEEVEGLSLGQLVVSINAFAKKYPKAVKPILFWDVEQAMFLPRKIDGLWSLPVKCECPQHA